MSSLDGHSLAVSAAGVPAFIATVARRRAGAIVERRARQECIAVCDNDGTLWAVQPTCFQILFAPAPLRHGLLQEAYDRAVT